MHSETRLRSGRGPRPPAVGRGNAFDPRRVHISKTDPAPWSSIQPALHGLVECIGPSAGLCEVHEEDTRIVRDMVPDGRPRVALPTVGS